MKSKCSYFAEKNPSDNKRVDFILLRKQMFLRYRYMYEIRIWLTVRHFRDLYRAIPAMTRDLGLHSRIEELSRLDSSDNKLGIIRTILSLIPMELVWQNCIINNYFNSKSVLFCFVRLVITYRRCTSPGRNWLIV